MRHLRAFVLVGVLVAALTACLPENQRYPNGYSGGTLTMNEIQSRQTVRQANFEFWRRVKALMEYGAMQGVGLGVGTCWRIQPANGGPGFASPGNSNHEGFPADGVSGGAVACDMVPASSWPWMEQNVSRFCLRTFKNVNNEPWHIQPHEIPASRNWRRTPWVLSTCVLPPPPPPDGPVYNPWHHQYGYWPAMAKPNVWHGAGYSFGTDTLTRGAVTYLNHVLAFEAGQHIIEPHFVFSIHTVAGVQNLQRVCGLYPDGIVAEDDWPCIDAIARARTP